MHADRSHVGSRDGVGGIGLDAGCVSQASCLASMLRANGRCLNLSEDPRAFPSCVAYQDETTQLMWWSTLWLYRATKHSGERAVWVISESVGERAAVCGIGLHGAGFVVCGIGLHGVGVVVCGDA